MSAWCLGSLPEDAPIEALLSGCSLVRSELPALETGAEDPELSAWIARLCARLLGRAVRVL